MRVLRILGGDDAARAAFATTLIAGLTRIGREVSVVAHAPIAGPLDRPGKDSHAHREAGAAAVAVVSGARWAIIQDRGERAQRPSLRQEISTLAPVDVVLALGYEEDLGDPINLEPDGSIRFVAMRVAPGEIDALCKHIARAP